MHLLSLVAVVLAVSVPPIAALVWGRRLSASRAAPGLADRWLAYVRAVTQVGMFSALLGIGLAPQGSLPILLAVLLGAAAGSLPVRRAVFGETWSLGAYLLHVLRFPVALTAFWILLAVMPDTAAAAGRFQTPVAVTLGLVLVWWSLRFPAVLSSLMGAEPIEGPAVGGRFQQIVSRSHLARDPLPPILLRAGAPGGTWAGLVSLPGHGRPRLIVSDTLLARLDLDELGALMAHALAYLELSRGALLLRSTLRDVLLIAGAALCAPLGAAYLGAEALSWLNLAWLVFVLVLFSRAATRVNRQQVACDRRAVELCGDPEALIRALSKMHALANLPTRWDHELGKTMAHPGLASRIEGIRRAAGLAVPTFDEEVVLESSERGRFAILGPEQVSFLEGVTEVSGTVEAATLRQRAASSRAHAYQSLSELHVKVGIGGAASLCATTPDGQRLRLPLAATSVARAHQALDGVDAKLGRRPVHGGWLPLLTALSAAVLLLAAFLPGIPGLLAAPALLLLWRQQVAPMLAAGTVALGAGLLAIAAGGCAPCDDWSGIAGPLMQLFGVYLFWQARRLARSQPESVWKSYRATVVVLLLGSVTLLPAAVIPGVAAGSLRAAGPLLAIALAVLVLARYHADRAARLAVAALLLAALLPALLGWSVGPGLLGQPGRLAGDPPELRWSTSSGAGRTVAVPAGLREVELSPSGRRFFGTLGAGPLPAEDANLEGPRTFLIADETGPIRQVRALALAFIDDTRVLALRQKGEGLLVEEVAPPGALAGWQVQLPSLDRFRLSANQQRFRVIGERLGTFVMFEGAIGGDGATVVQASPIELGAYRTAWIPSGVDGSALSVIVYPPSTASWLQPQRERSRTVLRLERPSAPPRALLVTLDDVSCPDLPLGSGDFLCVANGLQQSWVWSLKAGQQEVRSLLRLPRAHVVARADNRLVLWLAEGPALIDPAAATASRPWGEGPLGRHTLSLGARAIAIGSDARGVDAMTIYPIE